VVPLEFDIVIIETLLIIIAAFTLAFGASKLDATPDGPGFTWPSFTQPGYKKPMHRYRIVCKDPKGVLLFTVEGFPTEEKAQALADEFNLTRPRSPEAGIWTVEPLVYN